MEPVEIKQFCEYLQTRNYSKHTIENYGRDLRLFFAEIGKRCAESRGAILITSSNNNLALNWRRPRSIGGSTPSSISLTIWSPSGGS